MKWSYLREGPFDPVNVDLYINTYNDLTYLLYEQGEAFILNSPFRKWLLTISMI